MQFFGGSSKWTQYHISAVVQMWVEPFWGRRWEPGRRNWPLTRCGCLVAAHASREPGRLERGGNARTLGLPGSVGRGAGRCPGQRCGTGNALIAQGAEMPTRLASPGSIDVTFDMPPDAGTRGRDAGASTRGHLPPRGEDSGAGRQSVSRWGHLAINAAPSCYYAINKSEAAGREAGGPPGWMGRRGDSSVRQRNVRRPVGGVRRPD